MASVAQRYRARQLSLSLAEQTPQVIAANKKALTTVAGAVRAMDGFSGTTPKMDSLHLKAVTALMNLKRLCEAANKGTSLSLASIKEVQGPKLKASAKSLHSALKLAADQASRSGDQSTAADYADAASKMTGVI
jgi:GH15 family glucan-1,4-alpha-glucosidase